MESVNPQTAQSITSAETEPDYLVHIRKRQADLRETCQRLYPKETTITLELGCGHGHYLTAYAQAHPDEACLGIDLVTKRILKATAKAEKRTLTQLHFLKAEACELIESLPNHVRLGKIFMLFPDPWPKKRHHKNRMIQTDFLARLAEKATPDARFYYRTDHEAYFEWTQEILQAHPDWVITKEPWPFEERSFFQDLMDEWQSLVSRRKA